jgi:hypothetical protein
MIEAAKLALEALENTTPTGFNMERDKQFYAAITALRTAIKQAEKQEPVAEARFDGTLHWLEPYGIGLHRFQGPLYTTPPAAQQEPDAYGYAKRLAEAIWQKHYKATAPQWKPLDDLIGVLTQIDNMTAGLTFYRQPLTDEKIDDIWNRYCDEMGEASINDAYDIARAIEAAHGITGEKK